MRRFIAVLVMAVLALGLLAGPAVAAEEPAFEEFVHNEMLASGVPGVAYAVVVDGEIISAGGDGVVEAGDDRPVTEDTPFSTGSITKSFTALAVMQLVEQGEVDLDGEVSQYLDSFVGRSVGGVTVRQLLSHTSGFSTLQGNAFQDATGGQDELARLVEGLTETDLAYEPGERWEYSNTNYQVLGRLVEVVSGQEYQAYVTANILEPVGMDNSFVADGEIHESMATGHRPWFTTRRPLSEKTTHRGTAPQGGIFATAADLALYMQMMMNGEDDVLSAQGKAQMMRPASAVSPFYGLGWFVDAGNGSVWHSGLTPGFESLATMIPAEDKGVVVLVNANGGIGFGETTELRNGIAARALGLEYGGEGSGWTQKVLFLSLLLLPFAYLFSMIWAWRHRDEIRAKSGIFGMFSLWFPLLTTLAAAWAILWLVPTLIGSPMANLALFYPDLALAMFATAGLGVLWAVFRLGVACTGGSHRA